MFRKENAKRLDNTFLFLEFKRNRLKRSKRHVHFPHIYVLLSTIVK